MGTQPKTREEIALLVACYFRGGLSQKSGDSLARALLGSSSPYYQKPCSVYLYETECKGLIKFGISKDPAKRGLNPGKKLKPFYKKLLFSYGCDNRLTALAIEQALIQRRENLWVMAPHHIKYTGERPTVPKRYREQNERLRKFYGNADVTWNTELTFMSPAKLKRLIDELHVDWLKHTPREFFEKHAPDRMQEINEQTQELLDKVLVVVRKKEGDIWIAQKTNYDKFIPDERRFERYVYPFELNEGDIYVPLEEVPEKWLEITGKEMA